jgi:DNA-binding NarL/FixJ family response regulator
MLSPRQTQVLTMLKNCMTHKEMAQELGIKPSTVNAHIDVIRERLRNAGYEFTTRYQFLKCIDDWSSKNGISF